jgi:hypothetical protein
MALTLDTNKKYAILGKHLMGYINMCNKYNLLKLKLREYFNNPTEQLKNEIEEMLGR